MPILLLLFLIWLAMRGNLSRYWDFATANNSNPSPTVSQGIGGIVGGIAGKLGSILPPVQGN